jgi:hypothetical protein
MSLILINRSHQNCTDTEIETYSETLTKISKTQMLLKIAESDTKTETNIDTDQITIPKQIPIPKY